MTRRVYKYGPLEVASVAEIDVPAGAKVVAFSAQNGQNLYLWAEVDPQQDTEPLLYCVVGTGHALPLGPLKHAGSWVSDEYVWHLYIGASR